MQDGALAEMILLDTSVLIGSLSGPKRSAPQLRTLFERGERCLLSTLVLYEWFRGHRLKEELTAQEALFPSETAIPFGPQEALIAAELYRVVSRPKGREIDLAIAACALVQGAALWTLNRGDFRDIPKLTLV